MKRARQFAAALRGENLIAAALVASTLAVIWCGVPDYLTGCAHDAAARVAGLPVRDLRLSELTINRWDDTLDIPSTAGDVVRLPFSHPYSRKVFELLEAGRGLPASARVRLSHTDTPQFRPLSDADHADGTRYGTWLLVEPLQQREGPWDESAKEFRP